MSLSISGLLKSTKTVELEGKTITVKKYAFGFYEYLSLKQLEGKKMSFSGGKLTAVESFGEYDIDLYVDQMVNGIASWDLTDDTGYAIPFNRESCLSILKEFPDFARLIIDAIVEFNTPIIDKSKKK